MTAFQRDLNTWAQGNAAAQGPDWHCQACIAVLQWTSTLLAQVET